MFRRHDLLVIAVAALTGALSVSASAADWQQVAVDDDANRYSVDADRIIREGSLVKAFVRTEYATPREDETTGTLIFAAVDRLQLRCDEGSFALESRSYVAADGEEIPVVASDREALKFRAAAAGSMSAAIVQRLCAPDRKR
jgi:hypothetical protein